MYLWNSGLSRIGPTLAARLYTAGAGEQFAKNLDIRHDANAVLRAEDLDGGSGKMADISSAKDIHFTIGSRVENGVVVRIDYGQRLGYRRLNQMSGSGEIGGEVHGLFSRDSIPHLNPWIKQNPLDLVENEPRQNQCV